MLQNEFRVYARRNGVVLALASAMSLGPAFGSAQTATPQQQRSPAPTWQELSPTDPTKPRPAAPQGNAQPKLAKAGDLSVEDFMRQKEREKAKAGDAGQKPWDTDWSKFVPEKIVAPDTGGTQTEASPTTGGFVDFDKPGISDARIANIPSRMV